MRTSPSYPGGNNGEWLIMALFFGGAIIILSILFGGISWLFDFQDYRGQIYPG